MTNDVMHDLHASPKTTLDHVMHYLCTHQPFWSTGITQSVNPDPSACTFKWQGVNIAAAQETP